MKPAQLLSSFLLMPLIAVSVSADDSELSTAELRKAHTFNSGPAVTEAVALTFDDGPHPKLTLTLLDLLKSNSASATFFVLGKNVENYPQIAKKIVDEGFEIGNHSWTHTDFKKLSDDQIRDELQKTQMAIEQATGVTPKYFRPPYGSINDRVFKVVHEMGLEVVLWSVDPRDWDKKGNSPDKVKRKIVDGGDPGAIVCVHDIHSRTIEAMPETIAALQAKGLKLATVGTIIEAEKIERAKPKPEKTASGTNSYAPLAPAEPIKVPLKKTGKSRLGDL